MKNKSNQHTSSRSFLLRILFQSVLLGLVAYAGTSYQIGTKDQNQFKDMLVLGIVIMLGLIFYLKAVKGD